MVFDENSMIFEDSGSRWVLPNSRLRGDLADDLHDLDLRHVADDLLRLRHASQRLRSRGVRARTSGTGTWRTCSTVCTSTFGTCTTRCTGTSTTSTFGTCFTISWVCGTSASVIYVKFYEHVQQ